MKQNWKKKKLNVEFWKETTESRICFYTKVSFLFKSQLTSSIKKFVRKFQSWVSALGKASSPSQNDEAKIENLIFKLKKCSNFCKNSNLQFVLINQYKTNFKNCEHFSSLLLLMTNNSNVFLQVKKNRNSYLIFRKFSIDLRDLSDESFYQQDEQQFGCTFTLVLRGKSLHKINLIWRGFLTGKLYHYFKMLK